MHAPTLGSDPEPVRRRETLPPEKRLLKRGDFRKVYANGQKLHGRYVVLFASPNAQPEDRLGVTATKKVGGAAARNRLKRRVREVFRRRHLEAGRPPGGRALDFVVNVKEGADAAPFAELRDELTRLFVRGGGAR